MNTNNTNTIILFNNSEALLSASLFFDEIQSAKLQYKSNMIYKATKNEEDFILVSKNYFQSNPEDAREFYKNEIVEKNINKVIVVSEYFFIDNSFHELVHVISLKDNGSKKINFNLCLLNNFTELEISSKLTRAVNKKAQKNISELNTYLLKQTNASNSVKKISRQIDLRLDAPIDTMGMFYLIVLMGKERSKKFNLFNFLDTSCQDNERIHSIFPSITPILLKMFKKGAISYPYGAKKITLNTNKRLNDEERLVFEKLKNAHALKFTFDSGSHNEYSPSEIALIFSREKPHLTMQFWDILNVACSNGLINYKKIHNKIKLTLKGRDLFDSLEKGKLNEFYKKYS